MKRSTVAAIIIAVLLIASFVFIKFYHNNPAPSFSIIGEWQVDSAYAPPSAPDTIKQLTDAISRHKLYFHFRGDSTLDRPNFRSSAIEKYYLKDSLLFIDEGEGYTPYTFKTFSDSLIQLSGTDSVVFVLRRK